MNIATIGTGYVGLVSGTCFADSGNNVTCVDIDEDKIERLNEGEIPIYEPGLRTIFDRSVREDRLHFTTDLEAAVEEAEIIFLCLPTPPGGDGEADLSAVLDVAGQLGELISEYKIIVNKSTVPVGTAEKVRQTIAAHTDQEFAVVSNPEFLREGAAVDDFMKPERVIIGTSSDRAGETMHKLYEPFVRSGNPIITMDNRSAEMTKYAANALLATKISFMNEIANLAEKVGADVDNIRRGIGTDSRIGKRFLFAGHGFGGSCFPKDVRAILHTARQNDYDFRITDAVIEVNERQKLRLVEMIDNYFGEDLEGYTFGLWGLSFKPETDDVREAPALYVAEALVERGAKLKAYDPEAIETFKESIDSAVDAATTYVTDPDSALKDVDGLLINTEWNEFRQPDFEAFHQYMKQPVIFDGRNVYDLDDAEEAGIVYYSIGRRAVNVEAGERVSV